MRNGIKTSEVVVVVDVVVEAAEAVVGLLVAVLVLVTGGGGLGSQCEYEEAAKIRVCTGVYKIGWFFG